MNYKINRGFWIFLILLAVFIVGGLMVLFWSRSDQPQSESTILTEEEQQRKQAAEEEGKNNSAADNVISFKEEDTKESLDQNDVQIENGPDDKNAGTDMEKIDNNNQNNETDNNDQNDDEEWTGYY